MNNDDILANEDALLRGMLTAADGLENEAVTIEIARKGKTLFAFRVRPISEKESERCSDAATKYTRTRGIKVPESTDSAKYRSLLIYTATVDEDRKKTWDNRTIWDKLNVISGIDVIDKVLLPGEKDAVIRKLNEISGYGDDDNDASIEDTAKN